MLQYGTNPTFVCFHRSKCGLVLHLQMARWQTVVQAMSLRVTSSLRRKDGETPASCELAGVFALSFGYYCSTVCIISNHHILCKQKLKISTKPAPFPGGVGGESPRERGSQTPFSRQFFMVNQNKLCYNIFVATSYTGKEGGALRWTYFKHLFPSR